MALFLLSKIHLSTRAWRGFSFPINLFFEHRTLHIPKKEFFIMCLKKSTLLHPLFEQILLKKYLPDFH